MIHVLIERRIADGMTSTYEELAKNALHRCYTAKGFISGEAFTDVHANDRRFLLCKWRTELDWRRWQASEEREALINQIAPILEEPEKVTVLKN